jgi:hypothetical protein
MATAAVEPVSVRCCADGGAPFTGGPARRSWALCKLQRQRAMSRRYKQAQAAQRIRRAQEHTPSL